MRLVLKVWEGTTYSPDRENKTTLTYTINSIWYLGDKNKTPLQNAEEIQKNLKRKYGYKYSEDKELATEYVFSFITEMEGKHLNGEPVTKIEIANIFDGLRSKLPPVSYGDRSVSEDYILDILVPVEEREKKYTCNFEIYASSALENFVNDKQKFLEMYQVGSDEFAYDYEEEITKGAQSIFGKDRIEIAIYDFGGDSVDFKILIELITPNEEENGQYFWFINQSDKNLPKGITVQACLRMQEYSYNLVKRLYGYFTSND